MRSECELPLLAFDELRLGRRFRPFTLTVTADMVEGYVDVVGEGNDLYERYVPPGFAGVLGRSSYLQEHRMPPGGFLLRQSIEWVRPAVLDQAIVAEAEVVDREQEGDRRVVTIRTIARQDGEEVARVTQRAAWPQ